MSPRSIRRAAERRAQKLALKAERAASAADAGSETISPAVNEAPSISQAQLAANRQNAQHSTGPKSSTGKAKVSLNAVKTGLTGRTVLLPSDNAHEYAGHVDNYNDEFQPLGLRECELVQSLADLSWRLQRIPSLEMGIYAHGRIEFADDFDDHAATLRPSMIELQTFFTYEKQLRNLQLQEARLARRYEKELAELRKLQQDRKAREADEAAFLSEPKNQGKELHRAASAALLARQRNENF